MTPVLVGIVAPAGASAPPVWALALVMGVILGPLLVALFLTRRRRRR